MSLQESDDASDRRMVTHHLRHAEKRRLECGRPRSDQRRVGMTQQFVSLAENDFHVGIAYIGDADVKVIFGQTYELLSHADAALVTSGTATLETALFRVPQVVCYHTPIGRVIAFLKRHILKVKYISLVNLIAGREVVRELVADTMTVAQIKTELGRILNDESWRREMLAGYDEVSKRLGEPGAPAKAARLIRSLLAKS